MTDVTSDHTTDRHREPLTAEEEADLRERHQRDLDRWRPDWQQATAPSAFHDRGRLLATLDVAREQAAAEARREHVMWVEATYGGDGRTAHVVDAEWYAQAVAAMALVGRFDDAATEYINAVVATGHKTETEPRRRQAVADLLAVISEARHIEESQP